MTSAVVEVGVGRLTPWAELLRHEGTAEPSELEDARRDAERAWADDQARLDAEWSALVGNRTSTGVDGGSFGLPQPRRSAGISWHTSRLFNNRSTDG